MKTIPLTQGQVTKVDDEDFENLMHFSWSARWDPQMRSFYASRTIRAGRRKHRTGNMHREILGVSDPSIYVDHADHDTLNNQKYNLRKCTNSQNQANRVGCNRNSSTGVRGVSWAEDRCKWRAGIRVRGRRINLGQFSRKVDAAAAYAAANKKYFGDFGGI